MNKESKLNIPNLLSWFRIILIPIFVIIFYSSLENKHAICAIVFGIAGATDWLDGYLARKLNQMSKFGAFIDPVADKLIVVIALILLVSQQPEPWFTVPALIIIGREIVVSALREWAAQIAPKINLAVVTVAKYKTAMQMGAIFILLFVNPQTPTHLQQGLTIFGCTLLYIAAILTMWSMVIYLKQAWKEL